MSGISPISVISTEASDPPRRAPGITPINVMKKVARKAGTHLHFLVVLKWRHNDGTPKQSAM